jgi:hypothetical protein
MRSLILIFSITSLTVAALAQTSTNKNDAHSRLRLQVLSTYPVPVIDSAHADAKDIPGGFECGSTVKVTVNGKTEYHLFASVMEGIREKVWTYNRLEHWVSGDGVHWNRKKVLFRPHHDTETGLWVITASHLPYFDTLQNRWFVYFNYLALNGVRNWNVPTLLRRAGALTRGMEGINGDFEFPGEIVAPSGYAHPTDAFSSSISTPYKAADGRWYAFLGGGPKPLDDKSGNWWVSLVTGPGPEGPFKFMPEHSPEKIMDSTGFVENPIPMKIRGPRTGKEYWAIIFDYLKSEVTTGVSTEIGFSCSPDGINWPTENAQVIDIRDGFAPDVKPWVKRIRTPHQLIDEGDGTYTCFFTAYQFDGFESVGMMKVKVNEEILP